MKSTRVNIHVQFTDPNGVLRTGYIVRTGNHGMVFVATKPHGKAGWWIEKEICKEINIKKS